MEQDKSQNKTSLLDELNQLARQMEQQNRKEEIRRKRAEGGKKGGRPVLNKKRDIKKFFRINEIEEKHIKEVSEAWGVRESEYFRRCAMGIVMPDAERNKLLSEYHTNFKRISNIIKKDIWDEADKEYLKKELSEVIQLIKKNLQ